MPLSRLLSACLCLALSLAAVPRASAQADRFPDLWSPDLRVEGMAVLGDTLFATGLFRRVGPSTGQLAVLNKTTGEADTSYPSFDAFSSPGITTVVSDGEGGYYVGGVFSSVAEQPRRNLARVRPDGMLDPVFRPNPQFVGGSLGDFGVVSTLALDRAAPSPSGAGVLYVGGRFNTVGGQPREDIAALDAGTGVVLPFQVDIVQSGSFFSVLSAVASGSVLYVAGEFTAIGGQARTGLAALDATTGAVLPWGPVLTPSRPTIPDPYAARLALGDGTLYVAGPFDTIAGQLRPSLAEVTLADPVTGVGGQPTAWVPMEALSSFDLVVTDSYLWGNSGLGGTLARIDRITGAKQELPVNVQDVRGLAYDRTRSLSGQGTVYVGGQAASAVSTTRFPVVVAVDVVTGQPTGYRVNGASQGSSVDALAVEPGPDGRLFAGGSFTTLSTGVVRRQGLAAFDLTTGRPTSFAEGISGVGQGLFEDLALSPDGRFLYGYSNIVGGAALDLTEFDLVTGATRQFIPQGLTATTYGASAHVIEARDRPARRTEARTSAAPNPRVENAGSAVIVTDD